MAKATLNVIMSMSPELRKRMTTLLETAYSLGRKDALLELAVTAPKNDPATRASARKKAAKSGVALSSGAFPIPDRRHLFMAMQAFGRAKPEDRAKVVAHIRARAAALGMLGDARVKKFLADHAGGKTKGS